MSKSSIQLTASLYDYLIEASLREPDVLRRLREETDTMPRSGMQISPDQGQFMALLVELVGARRIIEVGTFTGYSALCMALAMPENGRLVACDVSKEWTAVARRYWREAGVANKIELRLAPALQTLDELITDGQEGAFDVAFIDAHKPEYQQYFERILRLLRSGGLAMIDNVLWSGRMLDRAPQDEETRAIAEFNRRMRADDRVAISMVPIGDGLTLARKK